MTLRYASINILTALLRNANTHTVFAPNTNTRRLTCIRVNKHHVGDVNRSLKLHDTRLHLASTSLDGLLAHDWVVAPVDWHCDNFVYVETPYAHDQLTGLLNHSFLNQHIPLVLNQAGRNEEYAALLYLDLDHFKRVNDTLGHSAGDDLLSEVARRPTHCVRNSDCVARGAQAALGGAEPIARLFSKEPQVIDSITLFLRIVPIGYGCAAVALLTGSGMNGINRPLHAAALGIIRTLVLQIPLAALLSAK